jgi:hypothetical protein
MVTSVIDHQYRSYWECLQEDTKARLTKDGVDYKTHFQDHIHRIWIYAHTLFQSPSFYSGHVEDIKGLEALLDGIVQKDRLPVKENLEGLMVLRSAWDVVDKGDASLKVYKYLSKFIYIFMLAAGIVTVTINVLVEPINEHVPMIDENMTPAGSLIFYLSVVTTFITAFNAYINPSGRWRQIRETTCGLESAIWQYRTRTGRFKMNPQDPERPTATLKEVVSLTVEALVSSSDIGQSTAWSRVYPASIFKHGQYIPMTKPRGFLGLCLSCFFYRLFRRQVSPEGEDGIDDHHGPLTPEKYIRFRLRRVMAFYRERLPGYARSRNLLSVSLMLVTALGTILAYKQFSVYVSICATAAAAITSWMEYNSVAKKIGRYNGTVSSLESLILWWASIPAVEKSVITNIDTLVQTGEQVRESGINPPPRDAGAGSGALIFDSCRAKQPAVLRTWSWCEPVISQKLGIFL